MSLAQRVADLSSRMALEVRKKAPISTSGPYSARPSASVAGRGAVYHAEDAQEMYVSNGVTWSSPIGGGNELASATITSPISTAGGTQLDVAGLSATFVAGERPVWMQLDCDIRSSALSFAVAYIVIDGVTSQSMGFQTQQNITQTKGVRKSFTPGTYHNVKVQMNGGATLTMQASVDSPATLSIRSV